MIETDDLITVAEAAEIRGKTSQAIYDLIGRGKLTPISIAGHVYLSRREIKKFKPGRAGRPRKEESK